MSRSGTPLVVTRASSEWCASPRQANAHVSVLPKHEICGACGRRSCIAISEGGTPTLITSRIRLRSAAGKRGWLSTAEPDRLEGGEGDRAALLLELVEGDAGLEVRHLQRRAAGREGTGEDRDAADVEERERRPEPVLGRQVQPLGDPLSLRHDRRVPVHAALRVGGGAGRVEHQPVVVATDLRQRGRDGRGVDALRARHERRVLRAASRPGTSPSRPPRRAGPSRWARRRGCACRSGGSRSAARAP